jgi:hypothetical protein
MSPATADWYAKDGFLNLTERIIMSEHHLAPTTRTLELAQIDELNEHLSVLRGTSSFTAGELGLGGAPLVSASGAQVSSGLPATAVLIRLSAEGPPEYPYVHGHFGTAGSAQAELVAELHTASLRRLSQLAGLHQRWGE